MVRTPEEKTTRIVDEVASLRRRAADGLWATTLGETLREMHAGGQALDWETLREELRRRIAAEPRQADLFRAALERIGEP